MKIDILDEKFNAAMKNLVEIHNDMGPEHFDKVLELIVIVLKKEIEKIAEEYFEAAKKTHSVPNYDCPDQFDYDTIEDYEASKK